MDWNGETGERWTLYDEVDNEEVAEEAVDIILPEELGHGSTVAVVDIEVLTRMA